MGRRPEARRSFKAPIVIAKSLWALDLDSLVPFEAGVFLGGQEVGFLFEVGGMGEGVGWMVKEEGLTLP
jgi:hypothetical protein